MDGRSFGKIFKDSKLVDKKFTSTSLDIIFSKAKSIKSKTITYEQFLNGVKLAAKEKQCEVDTLIEKISQLHGPEYHGTKA